MILNVFKCECGIMWAFWQGQPEFVFLFDAPFNCFAVTVSLEFWGYDSDTGVLKIRIKENKRTSCAIQFVRWYGIYISLDEQDRQTSLFGWNALLVFAISSLKHIWRVWADCYEVSRSPALMNFEVLRPGLWTFLLREKGRTVVTVGHGNPVLAGCHGLFCTSPAILGPHNQACIELGRSGRKRISEIRTSKRNALALIGFWKGRCQNSGASNLNTFTVCHDSWFYMIHVSLCDSTSLYTVILSQLKGMAAWMACV